jgi:hypothetical protein
MAWQLAAVGAHRAARECPAAHSCVSQCFLCVIAATIVVQDTRMRLLEMKTSVLEAIRERVELADDPAAGEARS